MSQFVQSGTLPWWADLAQPDILSTALADLAQHAPYDLRRLIRQWVHRPRDVLRLIRHVDDATLAAVLSVLALSLDASAAALFQTLAEMLQMPVFRRLVQSYRRTSAPLESLNLRTQFWTHVMQLAVVMGQSTPDIADLVAAVLHHMSRKLGMSPASLASAFRQAGGSRRAGWEPRLDSILAAIEQPEVSATVPSTPSISLQPETPSEQSADATPLDPTFGDTEELYIGNAGLVILWPFLTHFFDHLELLQDRQFKDTNAVQRAVGLLQVVVADITVPAEYHLPLNKILCGMDIADVFEFGPPATEAEREECENLLTAVIAQALILNNMSIPGFRRTFLLRQGVLSARGDTWLLRVERETYDIVLDRFPWAISWVKLPWMETAVQVEWSRS
ncbi:hypothetical protein C2W62_31245 [Candidatus Entotheonella serta]|nr:hypothetical protein C2W62_31245 [Candidatus Entotheonella serta]